MQTYLEENGYEGLWDSSGLDTSPDTDLVSCPGLTTEESASFLMVTCRVAKGLKLQLPTLEVKTNVLTKVLQPGQTNIESLLS